jgi:predicted nucleotidyltransferase
MKTDSHTSLLPIEVAKTVAQHLRERFGATRVLLFGSLASGHSAPGFSDIDIYFEGVPRAKVDEVTGRLMCHFSEYDIDFWPDARCEPEFRDQVLRTAISL